MISSEVEQRFVKPLVAGSTPALPANFSFEMTLDGKADAILAKHGKFE